MKIGLRIMTALVCISFGYGTAAAQTPRAEQMMNSKRQHIVEVAALTGKGDLDRLKTVLITILFEKPDTFFAQWFANPLALIFSEQCKSICSYFMRIYGGEFYAAGCTYVCSDIFHILFFFDYNLQI